MNKTEANKAALIEQLRKTPIVQIACQKVGVGRATYYRWYKQDDEFAELAEESLHIGSSLINDMAESQLLNGIKDQNMTAIIFWLKHHHKAYETRVKVQGTLKHQVDTLTDEQSEVVQRALSLGGLINNGNEGGSDE